MQRFFSFAPIILYIWILKLYYINLMDYFHELLPLWLYMHSKIYIQPWVDNLRWLYMHNTIFYTTVSQQLAVVIYAQQNLLYNRESTTCGGYIFTTKLSIHLWVDNLRWLYIHNKIFYTTVSRQLAALRRSYWLNLWNTFQR